MRSWVSHTAVKRAATRPLRPAVIRSRLASRSRETARRRCDDVDCMDVCTLYVDVQGTADRLRCFDVVSEEDLYAHGSQRCRRFVAPFHLPLVRPPHLTMAALRSRCGHYVFALWFLLSFFPRLISAITDWMSAVLTHMVWP